MASQKPAESQGVRLLRQLFLNGKRLFDMKDVATAATLEKIPYNQLRKILSTLAKHGRISRLRRGLYTTIGMIPEENITQPFVIATHLVQPSAISHWSALQHHGLTEQIPQIITASTPTKVVTPSMRQKQVHKLKLKHIWQIADIRYEYINIKQKHFFGIEKIWLDENSQVPITDKERTLLDVFIYPKMFGGLGEALGILENSLATIDIQKLVNYAIQYDKKSLTKRLGWTLEYFGVSAKQLEPLLNAPISYFCRLDPSAPATGPCDKRWMIQNNLLKVENK
ncbi:MAG: type IV toxin-antitoxin system AbiEi family antitoxin [Gammaproteobacteria bacterium]|nr:type IV toxin-antitoxin system AbiEi family antitoxin [Gammaproteobacteria bacterium]